MLNTVNFECQSSNQCQTAKYKDFSFGTLEFVIWISFAIGTLKFDIFKSPELNPQTLPYPQVEIARRELPDTLPSFQTGIPPSAPSPQRTGDDATTAWRVNLSLFFFSQTPPPADASSGIEDSSGPF